jgi:hypothetical protein
MIRQRKITGKLVRAGSAEAELMDREFWRGMDAEQKFAAAWEMVGEVSAMRGGDGNVPRVQRNAARLVRVEDADSPQT